MHGFGIVKAYIIGLRLFYAHFVCTAIVVCEVISMCCMCVCVQMPIPAKLAVPFQLLANAFVYDRAKHCTIVQSVRRVYRCDYESLSSVAFYVTRFNIGRIHTNKRNLYTSNETKTKFLDHFGFRFGFNSNEPCVLRCLGSSLMKNRHHTIANNNKKLVSIILPRLFLQLYTQAKPIGRF